MADSAKWYVIHTYSGYENKVANNIETVVENRQMQDQILEVKIPMETVTEIKDNKKRDVERKVFPGYVLVKLAVDVEDGEYVMSDDTWYVIRNTRGVTGFVGPESKPIPLSDEEVLAILAKQFCRLFARQRLICFIVFEAKHRKSSFFAHACSSLHIGKFNFPRFFFLLKKQIQHICTVLPDLCIFLLKAGIQL